MVPVQILAAVLALEILHAEIQDTIIEVVSALGLENAVLAGQQRDANGAATELHGGAIRSDGLAPPFGDLSKDLPGGKPGIDIAIPSFGYKSSIAICRTFGFIRKGKVTDAATFDGGMLRDVVTTDNTAADVWADTAYRSNANEAWLERHGRVSRIHRKKPRGRPMPERTARSNAAKSSIRARVEHVFARQKDQMDLVIRTIGITRATAKVTLANLAYNMDRLVFHERRAAMG